MPRYQPAAALLLATAALAPALGRAETVREFAPEFDGFLKLTDRARMFLLADAARLSPDGVVNGELGIHLDYTLMPILRPELRLANWQRARYFWTRIGYLRAYNVTGDPGAKAENRWLMELTALAELPGGFALMNRLRVDLRDIGGSHSRRYRERIHLEKEFTTASGVPFVPYAEAEFFYDTRFAAWSRRLFAVGSEFELDKNWRVEPYYAYEKNTNAGSVNVNRFGLILKYYR